MPMWRNGKVGSGVARRCAGRVRHVSGSSDRPISRRRPSRSQGPGECMRSGLGGRIPLGREGVLRGIRSPEAKVRIEAEFKHGLQTRDAEMDLPRMLGDWPHPVQRWHVRYAPSRIGARVPARLRGARQTCPNRPLQRLERIHWNCVRPALTVKVMRCRSSASRAFGSARSSIDAPLAEYVAHRRPRHQAWR